MSLKFDSYQMVEFTLPSEADFESIWNRVKYNHQGTSQNNGTMLCNGCNRYYEYPIRWSKHLQDVITAEIVNGFCKAV